MKLILKAFIELITLTLLSMTISLFMMVVLAAPPYATYIVAFLLGFFYPFRLISITKRSK